MIIIIIILFPDQYKQDGSIISNLSFLKSKGLRSPQHQRSPNSEDILALLESGSKHQVMIVMKMMMIDDDEDDDDDDDIRVT